MKQTKIKAHCCRLMLLLLLVSGCSTLDQGLSGMPQQDSGDEIRLKAVLLEAEGLAGSAINVTIDGDKILLDGFVETDSQRQRAEDLMRENSGLNDVINRITVK